MPPKKKIKKSKEEEKKKIPSDAQWCLDRAENLTFKGFIEHWDCLDRNRAQQQYGKIINDYFKSKNDRNNRIQTEYKNWTSSADYIRFWSARSDSIILLKAGLGSTELISDITNQRIDSLRSTVASSGSQTSDCQVSDSSNSSNSFNSSCSDTPTSSNTFSLHADPAVSPVLNLPTSLTNLTFLNIHNHLIDIRKSFLNEEDMKNHPWLYKDINISRLFNKYQIAVCNIIQKHESLPIESYVHELASLTHIFFLCKNQHSEIAEKIFSLDLLKDLTSLPELETMNDSPYFPVEHFMTITNTITNVTLNKRTREQTILDLFVLASQLNYNQKRLLLGVINLIQKLPCSPLNDYKKMSESELWSTYFDPLLSCLISDPDRLVHLRWTNTIPNEKGKSRPDAVISEKTLLKFGNNVGYGEAKTQQGCCSKLLCLDTLRLAIFTKNAIDVNKLDGALGFQIHGFNITFYLNQVTAKGIYTFKEIAYIRFPQSLEDLPSLFTLINIKNLLEINHIFWSICKKSQHPEIIEEKYKATQMCLDTMIDTSQDSTRQCVLRFGQ
ncbi:uncharacterized protein BX663DRAFT_485824 [Cokeromyces recurvatus]|uniref:uncharacterized protein n=1 Tax=Cokeromyces recurvatus TaxID=90255 RepID=UPI00221F8EC4|nr:uncharacterized protein BX663DRAFT_485824 [Cokeromyces recurvatus]KAI7903722.1 hypothetical protein BX663DRAFT_485824 [Cokeromyces recurvatus]